MEISVPRDRDGSFDPQIVEKHSRDVSSMEGPRHIDVRKGMSTRDISDIVKGIYGFDISAEMVSNITDRVVDDLAERQNRPLKAMYSFMFVDCMHVNVKRERRSEKHAVYVALAYDLDGHKDVLDLWVGESEGKHFWMGVFDELHRRGIRRISAISETSRPRRNIRPIDAAKKKEGRNAPPSGQPVSRLPACQFALPETIGALWGRTPPHGEFYRGHARYACHAHHAKRQVYQPGLSPLSRTKVL